MANPYSAVLEKCETARETEARLLRDVSRQLEQVLTGRDPVALAAAVARNRRVWSAFSIDLANPENGLPDHLRADLLSIAGAVDRSCSDALAGDRAALETLIEINRNLAAALA